MPSSETIRARQRSEDDRRLARWKSDDEVRPQIEASISARDKRWAKEDKEAETEARVRAQILENQAESRVRERILREQPAN